MKKDQDLWKGNFWAEWSSIGGGGGIFEVGGKGGWKRVKMGVEMSQTFVGDSLEYFLKSFKIYSGGILGQ